MDSSLLIKLIANLPSDSKKNNILSTVISNVNHLTSSQLVELISLYNYDNGKIKAIDIIVTNNKLLDISVNQIINLIVNDQGKNKMLRLLEPLCAQISLNQFNHIMNYYNYDEGKIKAFRLFFNKIIKIDNNAILDGLSKLEFDETKLKFLKKTRYNYIESIDDLKKLLDHFSFNKEKTIKIIKDRILIRDNNKLCELFSREITNEIAYIETCKYLKIPQDLVDKYKNIIKNDVLTIDGDYVDDDLNNMIIDENNCELSNNGIIYLSTEMLNEM